MTRSGKKFEDGLQWLYSCTCNGENLRFFNSLGSKLDCTLTSLSKDYCIHVKIIADLVAKFDALNYITPELDFTGKL